MWILLKFHVCNFVDSEVSVKTLGEIFITRFSYLGKIRLFDAKLLSKFMLAKNEKNKHTKKFFNESLFVIL